MSHTDPQIIVVANREPYSHELDGEGGITIRRAGSGVVNAVEPLLQACSGVWIAHGSATGDRLSAMDRDGVAVPVERPRYRLRRVWLSEDEEREYYDGAANSALWPLCHRAHVQPVFRASDFETYRRINDRFAAALAEEARDSSPVVLVQDYHFALAPELIRRRLPGSAIATFWHIPWPHWQTFGTCPWRRELLEGLLGSDVVGLQTAADCLNFVESVDRILGAPIDLGEGAIEYRGRRILVRDYAASIDWPGQWTQGASIAACRDAVRRDLRIPPDAILGVGVDRLDFTKGIEEKFLAIERLLEMRPDLRGRFVFVELAEPTRRRLATYRKLRLRVYDAVEAINRRFSSGAYHPIVLSEAHHSASTVGRYFRAADVCFVNSLHDGMNLVSKEFIAARDDEQGALVLSEFAGASNELWDAVLVNPYDIEGTARALATAIEMPPEEQRARMRRLRTTVAGHDAHHWASQILSDLLASWADSEHDPAIFAEATRQLPSSLVS
jgi:trehalose 6-phosphate synthase